MIFLEFLTALLVAIALCGVFTLAARKGGRRRGVLWLFLVIFLATWAGGIWMKPWGPVMWGIHWLTFLLVGLILALILLVSAPQRPPRGRHETLDMLERIEHEKEMEEVAYFTLNTFFWFLLFVLIVAILVRYIWM